MNIVWRLLFIVLVIGLVIYYFTSHSTESDIDAEDIKVRDSSGISLFLSGDVMTARGIDQILPHSVDPILYEPYVKNAQRYVELAERKNGEIPDEVDYDYIWGDALGYWEKMAPDCKIINLETSITDHDEPWPQKQIHYRMHPKNTQLFLEAGVDICALANNHTLDWGRPGLAETLGSLSQKKIRYAGAGMNDTSAQNPVRFEVKGSSILVFSIGHPGSGIPPDWSASTDRSGVNYLKDWDPERIEEQINRFSKERDIVVLSVHWGGNWGYDIPKKQQSFAHSLIDKGVVDLIHGHSSHHPKGVEVYKNKLILYGAGDFINDYEGISGHDAYRPELTLMYFPEINPANGDLIRLKMIPLEIRKFSLHAADEQDVNWLHDTMRRECSKLGGNVVLQNGILSLQWGSS